MTMNTLRATGDGSRRGKWKINFTSRALKAVQTPRKGRVWVYDSLVPGLAYLVTDSGARSFYFAHRVLGVPKRKRLGGAAMPVDEARRLAREYMGENAKGVDPIQQRKEQRLEELREHKTLGSLWDEFKVDRAKSRKAGTMSNYESYVEGPLLDWMDQPLKDITRKAVWDKHRQLGEASGKAYANCAMRVLSSMMSFAVKREYAIENPVAVLKAEWFKVKPRDNKISDDALADWFGAIRAMRTANKIIPPAEGADAVVSTEKMPDVPDETARVGADYLEFTLLTGLRRNESARLTWDRVDFKRGTVTIIDTKNSDPLVLPMSKYLLEMLKRRHAERGESDWVFPSPGRKGKEYFAEPRFAIDRLTALCEIAHSVHDLRRTFISAAGQLVPYPVLKKLVNHRTVSSNDITLNYTHLGPEDLRPHMETITAFFLRAGAAKDEVKA